MKTPDSDPSALSRKYEWRARVAAGISALGLPMIAGGMLAKRASAQPEGALAALTNKGHESADGNVNSLISLINRTANDQVSFIKKKLDTGKDHRFKKYHGKPLTPSQVAHHLGGSYKPVDVYTMSIPTGQTTQAIGDIKGGLKIYNDYIVQIGNGVNSSQIDSIKIIYGSVHPDHTQPDNPFTYDPYLRDSTSYMLTFPPEAQGYQVSITSSEASGKFNDNDIKVSNAYTIIGNQVAHVPDFTGTGIANVLSPEPASVSDATKAFQKVLDRGQELLHS